MKLENFKKWDLLPMSPSKLNGYRNYTCQFIIEKIYKRLGTSSPPAQAGNTVEPMLMDYVSDKEVDFDKYLNDFKIDTLDYPIREDVEKYIKDKCTTSEEINRIEQELIEYQSRNMYDLLRYMIYLVDFMRANNIVWGVGRGSSVASYVLYLIGIHKVNSIQYGLDYREFLR